MSETITTPVGRLVQGSLYWGTDKDVDGKQKVFKSGKNIGQPRTDFYFALAIPKESETHWNQTEWGQIIEAIGKEAFPHAWNRMDFSWKITDGDSTIFNTANPPRRPCDFEGFPGNWILRFSRPFAPKVYNADGSVQLFEENHVNPGDYIQVHALITTNKSTQSPGLFFNHLMVAFSGYGDRIITLTDPKSVGFGQAPLPAGASSVPPAAFNPPGQGTVPTGYTGGPVTVSASHAPYPQILSAATPPPPAPLEPIMLPAAQGLSYAQYKAAGWTDEQMIRSGILSA